MTAVWTCPFCPLACDHLGVRVAAGALVLEGGDCPRAQQGLSGLGASAAPRAALDGAACTLDQALAAAAALLAASAQPLFAGMATDVAGARALYPLACATGAICDGDAAAMPVLRALQDRGLFTTTLAEVRMRADVIVFVGGVPLAQAPLIGARCGIGEQGLARRVVVLGAATDDDAERHALAAWSAASVEVQSLPLQDGDLFTTIALLSAPRPPAPWAALAEQLRAARYAVLIGSAARLPAQGALIVEAVNRIVGQLNQSTRAAALWVGSATAQHTFAWLSGLPLRTQCGPALQHEPHLFDTRRLLAERAVDALLWVSSFEAAAPPPTDLPQIVLGPPALAAACGRKGTVFIAVATPGIDHAGHVLRTDGTVMMPLHAVHGVRDEGLPSVADVAQRLLQKVQA